ncbi:apolipoprotein Da, duplicate 2 [Denticeps clupeoides]|nr:apolipoprotein D-like [Denticeps clupeoides]
MAAMQIPQLLCLAVLSTLGVSAQTIHPGKCPEPPVQQNFDVPRYMGRWHEIQKLPAFFQKGKCAQATYTLGDGVVKVVNDELLSDGTISSIEGTAKPTDPSEPAKLEVTFFPGAPAGNYWVLKTDYDNYTLVYGCSNLGGVYANYAWILSRSRTLPEETVAELRATLTSSGIIIDKLTDSEQTGCESMPK